MPRHALAGLVGARQIIAISHQHPGGAAVVKSPTLALQGLSGAGLLWKRPLAGFLATRGALYGAGKEKGPALSGRPVESRLVTLHHEARQWLIHHPMWSKLYLQGCESITGSRSPRSAAKPAFHASKPIVSSAATSGAPPSRPFTRLQRLEQKLVTKAARSRTG